MTVRSGTRGTTLVHLNNLANPDVRLNLTSPLWELKDGQASEALGLDVVLPGRIRPDRGRKPVGVSLTKSDRPVSAAQGLDVFGRVVLRYRNIQGHPDLFVVKRTGATTYDPSNGQVSGAGQWTTYERFRDTDVLLIHLPASLRGAHRVVSRISNDIITIPAGLTAAAVSVDDFVLLEGKQIVEMDPYAATSGLKYMVKSPALYDEEGGWDPDMDPAVFWWGDSAEPWREQQIAANLSLVSIGTYAQENDAVIGPEWETGNEKGLTILFTGDRDRRGILITNGRKFWIQKAGVLTLLMDLGSDTYLGAPWRAARIATNRLLLVTAKHPPRVLHLDRDANTPVLPAGDETLAGCIPPRKPVGVEWWTENANNLITYEGPSWVMFAVAAGGAMTAGDIKVLVRGVNLEDHLASEFVPVLVTASTGIPTNVALSHDWTLDVLANYGVSIFTTINNVSNAEGFSPIIHGRITHIEVWRTPAGEAGNYYLEARGPIYDRERGRQTVQTGTRALFKPILAQPVPISLADVDLIRLPLLTTFEFEGGGLPPICRDAVSLLGVTLCFGKAASDRVDPTLYAKNFFMTYGTYTTATGLLTDASTNNAFERYTFTTGDELVVTNGGVAAGKSFPTGIYPIVSAVTNGDIKIEIESGLMPTGVNPTRIQGYIRRPYIWPWPFIASDEDVWYSRTDTFGPEGFPPRIEILSKTGDTFRRAVIVGKYAVVIMDQAVHLLWIDFLAGKLEIDTVATKGAGTPWPNSVVVFERRVLWATPRGIRTLEVSNEPDEEGHRGRIGLMSDQSLLRWFEEAEAKGDAVDAGIDARNETLRIRRRSPAAITAGSLSAFLPSSRKALQDDLDPAVNPADVVVTEPPSIPLPGDPR